MKLVGYNEFSGRHWETGSVRNVWAYRGVKAPHTDAPFSEAFLLGVSGGIVMGYFTFAYQGYDPEVRILTRNTFDPLNTLLSRLGVVQHIRQTASADTGLANLQETLTDGLPAIVWADMFSLPYNALPHDENMWAMFPLVVYGFDAAADTVWIADRAQVPLTVRLSELAAARARVKNHKFRLMTIDPPQPQKLKTAVLAGLWDTIKLFTEKPPKGAKKNFGFAAYQNWADLLVKPKGRGSWAAEYASDGRLYAVLTSAFTDIALFGKADWADRDLFADFLQEAALLLDKPALADIAPQFRASGRAWADLGAALLPDGVPLLQETRELLLRRRDVFLTQGGAGLEEIRGINGRLAAIKQTAAEDFPLSAAETAVLRETIRDRVLTIHDMEKEALTAVRDALS
ncbi:MAG: DUF4872 domain-containing protein [Chloroflexi bacterium]|nr:DUF4872 domain-containing protein [Chloroflexota bacterium]